MTYHRAGALVLLLAMFTGCQPAPEPPPPVDENAVREAVAQSRQAFVDAALSGDAEGFLSYWTDDLHIMEPGVDMGRAEWEEFIGAVFSTTEFVEFELRSDDVFVHGDVAYEFGKYDETVVDENQDTTLVAGFYSIRWEQGADGVWRMDRVLAGPREEPGGM